MSPTDSQNLNSLITAAVQVAISQSLGDGGVWRAACDAVVSYRLANGKPFSSGEVAAILRTFDPTLNFAVSGVGERLRDAFGQGEFDFSAPEIEKDTFGNPELDDNGDPKLVVDGNGDVVMTKTPAQQVSRYTEGLGRTPAGVLVFVYAPSYADGEAHNFEVDIPRPNIPAVVNPATGVPDVPEAHVSTRDPSKDDTRRAAQVATAAKNGDLACTVQVTGRMNVGRLVLENYALMSRTGLQADATLYVWQNGKVLTCRLADDPSNPAKVSYKVFRGRTLINLDKLGLSRPQGTTVNAVVDPSGITISL